MSAKFLLQELEKKQEELKATITDLRKEINQRQHEIKSLKEDLESNVRRSEAEQKRLEGCFEQIESLKVRAVDLSSTARTHARTHVVILVDR